MGKKYKQLEEGDIFSIKLDDSVWTIAQLCNLFTKNRRYSQYTLAFFNYKFETADEISEKASTINLKIPIAIFTINGHPLKDYKLDFVEKRDVFFENIPDFKKDISPSLGMYKNRSMDFEDILKAFFGLLPWDCFYKDTYVDESLIEGIEKRDDVKFMKDFSTDELKTLLPSNNIKLQQLLGVNEFLEKKDGIQTVTSLEDLLKFKPTLKWKESFDEDIGLYSEVIINETNEILDQFIFQLITIEQEKVESKLKLCVKEVVLQLNKLNKNHNYFIETDEREELYEFIDQAARIMGVVTDEDITEAWRDW